MFQRFEQVSSRILKPFTHEELVMHVREALEENADTIAAIRRALAAEAAPPPPPVTPPVAPLPAVAPERSVPEVPADPDAALLRTFFGSSGLQREMAAALRAWAGPAGGPLARGPSSLLRASDALAWALHQPQRLAVTLRCEHEVIEVYVAGCRIVGVGSDAWPGAARGLVTGPAQDAAGLVQEEALARFCAAGAGGTVEVRELQNLPGWTLAQAPEVRARLSGENEPGVFAASQTAAVPPPDDVVAAELSI